MSENNDKQLQVKLENEIKKYELLKKCLTQLYESEKKSYKKRLESYDEINKIKETDNDLLSDIYRIFNEKMQSLERTRDIHLKNLHDKFLPITELYPKKLKEYNNLIKALVSIRKKINSMKKEKEKAEKYNELSKITAINEEIEKESQKVKNQINGIEHNICKYESERINDNKYLLMQYINSELNYHAKALEIMSELFQRINLIDPQEKLPEFMNKYEIKIDLNEIDLNINEIEKRKEEKNREIKKQKQKMYDDDNEEINTQKEPDHANNNTIGD